jgi:1,4-alpha-glucan branching enzyme
VNTFVGSASWGDQPSHLFAVENSYGGPRALKQSIKVAHEAGLCVILDVVYHHFAGQEDARRTIRDNVRMWIEEYHFDGLRIAGTSFIRSLDGANGDSRRTGEGWKLLREINVQLEREYPGRLCIAEDLHDDAALTVHPRDGGAGFSAQWQYDFAARVRRCTVAAWDDHRSMDSLRSVLEGRLGCDAFKRVLFTECHDKRSPAAMRLPSAICPDQPESWWSRKRSTLAAGLLLTAPGVPMLFQGQEFLQTGPFDEAQPLDWPRSEHFAGILQLYRDLLHLRLNREGHTRGLCGQGVHCFHVDDERKVIAYRRWDRGGIKDDVLVVANCAHEPRIDYRIGLPLDGAWKLRFNSDARVYCDDFADIGSGDMVAQEGPCGGLPYHAVLSIGPYSLQIYSHEAAPVV